MRSDVNYKILATKTMGTLRNEFSDHLNFYLKRELNVYIIIF